jgi:CBS domain-containing protein
MAKRKAATKESARPQVKDIMIGEVMTIEATATLLDAARQMRDANIGMLPVVEDGTLRGVITDRDLVVRAMSRDVRPSEMKVAACLSEPPRYAEPDWDVDEAMVEMARQHVGRLPVVDDAGAVVGVVTLSSLALRSPQEQETLQTAREVSRRSARIG